jgi:hypothetical protein
MIRMLGREEGIYVNKLELVALKGGLFCVGRQCASEIEVAKEDGK